VTNPGSGDLTIFDIDTRHLSASVHVGEDPGEVLLTPDGEYALVVDRRSGGVSVVRIATVLDHKVRASPVHGLPDRGRRAQRNYRPVHARLNLRPGRSMHSGLESTLSSIADFR